MCWGNALTRKGVMANKENYFSVNVHVSDTIITDGIGLHVWQLQPDDKDSTTALGFDGMNLFFSNQDKLEEFLKEALKLMHQKINA